MLICFVIFSVVLAILCGLTVYYYGRSTQGRRKKRLDKQEMGRMEKSGMSTAGFDAQSYVLQYSNIFGVSNMGVSMDQRKIFVCPLFSEEEQE